MSSNHEIQARRTTLLRRTGERLKGCLGGLGMNLSVRDDAGEDVAGFEPCNGLCKLLCANGRGCAAAMRDMAERVLKSADAVHERVDNGCCLLAVPVNLRRRTIGVAISCFPAKEDFTEQRIAEISDSSRLDSSLVGELAVDACTRSASESGAMLEVFKQLLGSEQSYQVSQEEIASLSMNLATSFEELNVVYNASKSMRIDQSPEAYLKGVCEELQDVLNAQAVGAIVKLHPDNNEEQEIVVACGETGLTGDLLRGPLLENITTRLAESPRGFSDNEFSIGDQLIDHAIHSLMAVSLTFDGPFSGVMFAVNKAEGEFGSIGQKLLSSIASQSAVFTANSRLYADVQDLLMGVLHAMTSTIDAKDPYTCGHSQRVAIISRRLAESCGFDRKYSQRIYLAGLMHDIGKVGVDESILCKEGKLTDSEYQQMQRHPQMGAKILGGIRQLDDVRIGILTHHERLDGKGYPQGLKGEEVPMDGLIIGLADAFDAMTSNRTYRASLPLESVAEELQRYAGKQFHAELVETFLSWDLPALLRELHAPVHDVFPVLPDESSLAGVLNRSF